MQQVETGTSENYNGAAASAAATSSAALSLVLLTDLEKAASAYKCCATEAKAEVLVDVLKSVCSMLCFADVSCLRQLYADRYATALVLTLTKTFSQNRKMLRSQTVQALSLVSSLVPRGPQAIESAKGIPPLIRLANDPELTESDSSLEDLLKCLNHLSTELHTTMVKEGAIAALVSLESRVVGHHLRIMCLRSLSNLFARVCAEEWSSQYLFKPCLLLVTRFRESMLGLLEVYSKPIERLTNEAETHLLCILECISCIFDRMLCSPSAIKKNDAILEQAVPVIVGILKRTATKSLSRGILTNAACSPLLMLFITDPNSALRAFMKNDLIRTLCGTLIEELDGWRTQRLHNSATLAEALRGDNLNIVPCVSDEQQAISLLESLLVIIPAARNAGEKDWYVTLPHYTWQCEDDFHNLAEFNESICKKIECEYQSQRMSVGFSSADVFSGERVLRVNFKQLQYTCGKIVPFPSIIHRKPTFVGFLHRRTTRCCCGEASQLLQAPVGSLLDLSMAGGGTTRRRYTNTRSVATVPSNVLQVPTERLAVRVANQSEVTNGGSVQHLDACISDDYPNIRLVEDKGVWCSDLKSLFVYMLSNRMNKKRKKQDRSLQRGKYMSRKVPCDLREEVLRSTSTRSLFLNGPVLQALVSHCIPACLTVIKRTVSPIIARHCSILILRCVDLITEFMHLEHVSHRELVLDLQMKLGAMAPTLGWVLSYLIVNVGPAGSQIVTACPFSEFHGDPSLREALVALNVKPGVEKPAPSVLCEVQMGALGTFLLLHHSLSSGIRIFNDTQRLAVLRHIEKILDSHEKHKLQPRSVSKSCIGHLLCPFHATAEEIEESNKILPRQVAIMLRNETAPSSRLISSCNSLSLALPTGNCGVNSLSAKNIRDSETNNLMKETSFKLRSPSSSDIMKDIYSLAESYSGRLGTIQLILALSDYIKAEGADVPSLVHEIPEFFDLLATGLEDPVVGSSLDVLTMEAFAHIAEYLTLYINEHTDHVCLDDFCVIDEQPSRISSRFCRSRVAVSLNDRMWCPLRVSLEQSTDVGPSGNVCPQRTTNIHGRRCTLLNVKLERGCVSILPTAPLSYLAKFILSNLTAHDVECFEDMKDLEDMYPRIRRRFTPRSQRSAEWNVFGTFYPNPEGLMSPLDAVQEESRDEPESLSQHFLSDRLLPTFAPTDSIRLRRASAEFLPDSFTMLREALLEEEVEEDEVEGDDESEEERDEEGTGEQKTDMEHVLGAVSIDLPYFQTQHYPVQASLMDRMAIPVSGDSRITVTIDNIVFICNGKPVTNLSASVLELCCNNSAVWETMSSTCVKNRPVDLDESDNLSYQLLQKARIFWSTVHTIQFAVLKKPLDRSVRNSFFVKSDLNDNGGANSDSNNKMTVGLRDNSPKNVFAQILQSDALPLRSAARLLHGLKKALRGSCVKVIQDDRRLCGALIHNFYSHHSALMLPPFTLPALCASLYGTQHQHLPFYILWNYPYVFSFEIRRTLLHLLLATRRVETPVFISLQDVLQRSGNTKRVHGLEWLTADVSLRGTKKVKVSRNNILKGGIKVLRNLAMCPLTLSIQFKRENGVGVGPAMEFYNLFANQLQSKELRMWKTEEFINVDGSRELRVRLPLFPAAYQTHESLAYFEVLGLLVGRVLMEERVVDLPLHPAFLRGILGDLESNKFSDIDYQLDEQHSRLLEMDEDTINACDLFFVLPHNGGENIDLCYNGSNTNLTVDNVKIYVDAVKRYYCHTVLMKPLLSFMQGLRYTVIPEHLQFFDADELNLLICGPEGKLWNLLEDLERAVIPSHGYDADSPVIRYLLEILLEWKAPLQRAFLRFVTGSNRIPVGGLRPPITVVRRSLGIGEERGGFFSSAKQDSPSHEKSVFEFQLANASLPTVNTCVHYLKLPNYNNKEILEDKLRTAIMEGQDRFFLT